MLAAVLHGIDDIRFEESPTPQPGPGEVLIDVRATGVCGSDVPRVLRDAAHYYPIILGHEFAGVVAELGDDVDTTTVGDRVAVAPLMPCHRCAQCQRGQYSMCPSYSFIGSSRAGALAQYVVVPAVNLVKLADSVSFTQAAMIEPSTVALHGVRVGDFRPGGHVAILGGGTVGLFTAQWARILGAKTVTVVDIDAHRLSVADQFGVTHTIDSRTSDPIQAANAITDGEGFAHVFETAGQIPTQNLALKLVARAGSITLIGNAHDDPCFPAATFELLNRREVTLTASWMSYSPPFPGVEWLDTAHRFATGDLRWSAALLHDQCAWPLSAVGHAFGLYHTPGRINGKLLFTQDV
ncbi:MAG: galactitol-1-phosphate 5-dehydrogenase [Propionibacteriaceae bacterium]|jgi:L-iditol 2-dehydrogenase|nr:galactitol-1-phosphate 5-dehydrogenase [Propionibacteriaceae bacterium]